MNCSYYTDGTDNFWRNVLEDASEEHCQMPDMHDCCNECQACNLTGMADHFMRAVKSFLHTDYAKTCSQRSVTEVNCLNLPVRGHLFVNKMVCNDFKDGLRPTKDNIMRTCSCYCGCRNSIYCKVEPGLLQTTTMTTTVTTKTTKKVTPTVDTTTTVQKESTTPAVTTSITTAPPHTYPPEHTTSSAVTFTKQAVSTSNTDGVSSAAIGGSVGGVIVLVVVAILLMIFVRRRSPRQKKTQNNHQNHSGAFFNTAYNQNEVNLHSTGTGFNMDRVIVPNGHFGNIDEHEYANTNFSANVQFNDRSNKSVVKKSDYEFAKPEGKNDEYLELKLDSNENSYERLQSQQNPQRKSQFLPEKYADTDNYEVAKPVPINNDENYFEIEPQSHEDCDVKSQQNCAENYFVLEKENLSTGNIDDVYNTLNENLKTNDDDNKDEYHHLRAITRSGREGTNHVDDDANDDYDMLKNGAKNQDDFFNEDYDHCKPRKFPNEEDDYDHFT